MARRRGATASVGCHSERSEESGPRWHSARILRCAQNDRRGGREAEKGVGNLLPERPFGCCAQKVPDPFSRPLFPAIQQPVKGHHLLEQTQEVGPGATGRIDRLQVVQGGENLAGVRRLQLSRVLPIDQPGDGRDGRAGSVRQVAFERLAAHERDDRPRRVIGARGVAPGHQFLEHPAQHLGVYGHFEIQRAGFLEGKVVEIEQSVAGPAAEDAREYLVRQVAHLSVQRRAPEQPLAGKGAGKGVRHLLCAAPEGPCRQKVPDPFSLPIRHASVGLASLFALDREAREEQRAEPPVVERFLAVASGGVQGAKIVRSSAEVEPSFAFQEPQEHEAVE